MRTDLAAQARMIHHDLDKACADYWRHRQVPCPVPNPRPVQAVKR